MTRRSASRRTAFPTAISSAPWESTSPRSTAGSEIPRTSRRELSEGLKKEESAFKRTLLTTIRSAALARNQYWTTAAWLLERKHPDEFGKADRQRDDAKADAAPRIVLGVVAQPVQQTLPLDGLGEERADG